MTPFRRRRFFKRKKLRFPAAPQPDRTRTEKCRAEIDTFVPNVTADRQARLNIHQYPQDRADYPRNPFWNVVIPTHEFSDEMIGRWMRDAPGTSDHDDPEEPSA